MTPENVETQSWVTKTAWQRIRRWAGDSKTSTTIQGSRMRNSVHILFFERYIRTLAYSILAYVNNNRPRIRLLSKHQQLKVSGSMLSLI